MRARLAMYGAPILAILAAAVVLLGPGRPGPALGIRVWGAPSLGARCTAFRLEGIRRYFSVDDRVALSGLAFLLRDSASGDVALWTGASDQDGIADVPLCLNKPLSARAEIEITRNNKSIARGEIAPSQAAASVLEIPVLAGITRGELQLQVKSPRGVWVAPFEDKLSIALSQGSKSHAEIWLSAHAEGAELQQQRLLLPADRPVLLKLKPSSHMVELTLKAHVDGVEQGVWEGIVPVVPGGIWLDPNGVSNPEGVKQIRLLSPSPRKKAYVSLLTEQGRVFGATVPLAPSGDGFFVGLWDVDLSAHAHKTAVLVVAGDPFEQGSGTLAWPILPAEGRALHPPMELLLDGLPQAESAERERAFSARKTAVFLILALAIFEFLFFFARSRQARRALEAHFAKVSQSDDAGLPEHDAPQEMRSENKKEAGMVQGESWLWALVLLSLLGLGFALVAALALFR